MEDEVITISDMLEDFDSVETIATLAGSALLDKCSYPQGYMKRQSIFACTTCCGADKEPAGFCIGCLRCHDGHEIINLYTKRNFRCDCGNSKFETNKCSLFPDKDPLNISNKYGQNFKGSYCTCHRPYPDPENDIPDEMVQCVICEDWFHTRHLVPSNLNATSGEVICQNCTSSLPFISAYCNVTEGAADGDEEVEVEAVSGDLENQDPTSKSCKISDNANPPLRDQAVVLPFGWRDELCLCSECMKMYENLDCTFLLDEIDCLENYLKENEETASTSNDLLEKCMGQLNRVGQIEFLHGYNNLKQHLAEFFRKHMENDKVIDVKDVEEFVEQLRKNPAETCEVPYYCR